ncbi:pyridoxamine 5'-phosphate oxidase family protein [Nonomuraea rubra]|uniref:pyridoxamine 5'-phosphate oxidase family protein n=1 Tax=Nonomuraea rubra TaxID=46180 RepID=UPI0031EEBE55
MSNLVAEQRFGALATVKADGRPQLSTVAYTWEPRQRVVADPHHRRPAQGAAAAEGSALLALRGQRRLPVVRGGRGRGGAVAREPRTGR